MNNNEFINQFSENIRFNYTYFDRVIIDRLYFEIFPTACVVRLYLTLVQEECHQAV